MKRPAFQFYPKDWRDEQALRLCSMAARGLWIDMMCLMHSADRYGHLEVAGKGMTTEQVARLVGEPPKDVKVWMAELQDNGVCSVTDEGVIYSRRMVRDEAIREKRAAGGEAGSVYGYMGAEHGFKGGRPTKDKGGNKPPLPTASDPPSNPPPAFAVASAVASAVATAPATANPLSSPPAEGQTSLPGDAGGRETGSRATRLPTDWELPGDWAEDARREHPGIAGPQLQRIEAMFRDYWHSKGGADARRADWRATWRNWVRREKVESNVHGLSKAGRLTVMALQEFVSKGERSA